MENPHRPVKYCQYNKPQIPLNYEIYFNETWTDETILKKIQEDLCEDNRREIVRHLIEDRGLVAHQIESFDKFMDHYVPSIIYENSNIVVDDREICKRYILRFGKIDIPPPSFKESNGILRPIYPYECTARGLTYTSSVYADIHFDIYSLPENSEEEEIKIDESRLIESRLYKNTLIFQTPCMVRSKYCRLYKSPYLFNQCPYDKGGIFIINGTDKACISQERIRFNYPRILRCKQDSKYNYQCEVRSCHESKMRSTSTINIFIGGFKMGSDQGSVQHADIFLNIPYVKYSISISKAFRLLGLNRHQEMCDCVLEHMIEDDPELISFVKSTICGDPNDLSHEEICCIIADKGQSSSKKENKEKKIKYAQHLMASEFLPHLGIENTPENARRKLIFFGYCIYRLCATFLGRIPCDDPDDNGTKRLNTCGVLLAYIVRSNFRSLLKKAANYILKNGSKPTFDMSFCINQNSISCHIKYATSTGNWGAQKQSSSMTGVMQVLSRMTITALYSNLRRINSSFNKEAKMIEARQLKLTHWFKQCPAETPEGPRCGLLRNMTLSCYIRNGCDTYLIEEMLIDIPDYRVWNLPTQEERKTSIMVLVNGILTGYTTNGDNMTLILRKWRRKRKIPFDSTIFYLPKCRLLQIDVDNGCYVRPVFKISKMHKFDYIYKRYCENSSILMTELISKGIIEYISTQEEETLRIAIDLNDLLIPEKNISTEPYTHIEIHPILILGVCASIIPFAERNPAARIAYQSAMQKHSHSLPCLNENYRYDPAMMSLWYPQVPLVQTMIDNIIGTNVLAIGQNATMAILPFKGFSVEDAIIFCKDSIDRGQFRSTLRKTIKEEQKIKGSDMTEFGIPPKTKDINYNTLCPEKAFALPGTRIKQNDGLIGKSTTTEDIRATLGNKGKKKNKNKRKIDCTTSWKGKPAFVEQVVETTNRVGIPSYRMVISMTRIPEIGDKFSTREAQKSTIATLYSKCDMPFNHEGITPDIIVNPHGFPSRMTMGKLAEGLASKYAVFKGLIADGTPFGNITMEEIEEKLHKCGCQRHGTEVLYNPFTGEPMEAQIFMVPIYYQKLRHMVEDKIHSRAKGKVQILTGQPVEGRARDGGLRLGEMERDCILAHGATQFLKERLFEQSDAYVTVICAVCGLLAIPARPHQVLQGGVILRAKKAYCKNCDSYETPREVQIPYALKLLIQELMACNIALRLRFRDFKDDSEDKKTEENKKTEEDKKTETVDFSNRKRKPESKPPTEELSKKNKIDPSSITKTSELGKVNTLKSKDKTENVDLSNKQRKQEPKLTRELPKKNKIDIPITKTIELEQVNTLKFGDKKLEEDKKTENINLHSEKSKSESDSKSKSQLSIENLTPKSKEYNPIIKTSELEEVTTLKSLFKREQERIKNHSFMK